MRHVWFVGLVAAAVLGMGRSAGAMMIVDSGDVPTFWGSTLHAQATFDVSTSGDLLVTLTNLGGDATRPADVLTGVFFSLEPWKDGPQVGALTPVSALLDGSTVHFGADGGGNVGGEWAYEQGLVGAPRDATRGISSTGLDLFGQPNFNGPNLQDPAAVDGLNYGIVSANDDPLTGNAKVTGGVPLIQDSVVFTLSGLPTGWKPTGNTVKNVSFQYGTSLAEPNLPGNSSGGPTGVVPEPATLLLFGTGLAGLSGVARRRRRHTGAGLRRVD